MQQRKAKSRRRRRGRGKGTNGTAPFTGVSSAPAGTNEFMQYYTRFKGKGQSLGISACLPICEVAFQPDPSPGSIVMEGTDVVTPGTQICYTAMLGLNRVICLADNLGAESGLYPYLYAEAGYISPVFDLIGSCFVRWRVNGLKFHYTPQSTTTVQGRAVFAFAEDPLHPLLNRFLSDAGTNPKLVSAVPPTQTILLALSDSMAFAPWLPWSMDLSSRVRQNELYTTVQIEFLTETPNFAPDFASDDVAGLAATMRQSALGCFSIVAETTEEVGYIGGVLWMELDFDLIEFCPTTETIPFTPSASTLALRKRKAQEELKGRKKPLVLGHRKRKVSKPVRSECRPCEDAPATDSNGSSDRIDLRQEMDLERARELFADLGFSPSELTRLARKTPKQTTKGAPSGEAD